MHSSAAAESPLTDANAVRLAERLCGATVNQIEQVGGGGNNRVYRIRTGDVSYALKCYAVRGTDERDRLGHEFEGLRFLRDAGLGAFLPAPLASDTATGCALYEWVEGERLERHGVSEVSALLELLAGMHHARRLPAASALPRATEATIRMSDALDQIEVRLSRLEAPKADDAELAAFLDQELAPQIARARAGLSHRDVEAPLSPAQRTLSPSDFGFHNALRRPDGSLVFLDFEYFGWDDPVKLVSDFLWHPGTTLSDRERLHFRQGAADLYGDDPDFHARFSAAYPLHGLRWCLIILNEFIPAIWQRRVFAGRRVGEWDAVKCAQLAKARGLLARLRSPSQGLTF